MSDEKPFARVETVNGEYRWMAGDAILDTDSAGWPTLAIGWREMLCDVINAAVEQREAKLRGALLKTNATMAALATAAEIATPFVEPFYEGGDPRHDSARRTLLNNIDFARRQQGEVEATLAGAGPDYVPAAELAAEKAKVKQLQAAIDALDPGQYANWPQIEAMLVANGWRKPEPEPTDDETVERALRLAAVPADWAHARRYASTLLKTRRGIAEQLARDIRNHYGYELDQRARR